MHKTSCDIILVLLVTALGLLTMYFPFLSLLIPIFRKIIISWQTNISKKRWKKNLSHIQGTANTYIANLKKCEQAMLMLTDVRNVSVLKKVSK